MTVPTTEHVAHTIRLLRILARHADPEDRL
jgi:hypothetical protein